MQGICILENLSGLSNSTELLRVKPKRQALCLWLFFILEVMVWTTEFKDNEMNQEYHRIHSTHIIFFPYAKYWSHKNEARVVADVASSGGFLSVLHLFLGPCLTPAKNGEVGLLARNGGVKTGIMGSKSLFKMWQIQRKHKSYLSTEWCYEWESSPLGMFQWV